MQSGRDAIRSLPLYPLYSYLRIISLQSFVKGSPDSFNVCLFFSGGVTTKASYFHDAFVLKIGQEKTVFSYLLRFFLCPTAEIAQALPLTKSSAIHKVRLVLSPVCGDLAVLLV